MPIVTLNLPKEEIGRILSQLSSKELEGILKEAKIEHEQSKPKFIPAKKILNLKGIISIGGNALIDSEKIYDG